MKIWNKVRVRKSHALFCYNEKCGCIVKRCIFIKYILYCELWGSSFINLDYRRQFKRNKGSVTLSSSSLIISFFINLGLSYDLTIIKIQAIWPFVSYNFKVPSWANSCLKDPKRWSFETTKVLDVFDPLRQGLTTFSKGRHTKYFKLCRPYHFCCKFSTLLLQCKVQMNVTMF